LTWFEFVVPLVGFAVAGIGIWFFRRDALRLERHSTARRSPAE
jgi:hypothetical protein